MFEILINLTNENSFKNVDSDVNKMISHCVEQMY